MAVIDVWAQCPGCSRVWLIAQIHEGAWWAKGVTPESCLKSSCSQCQHPGPMALAHQETQLDLLGKAVGE